jgi:hypothetical protein
LGDKYRSIIFKLLSVNEVLRFYILADGKKIGFTVYFREESSLLKNFTSLESVFAAGITRGSLKVTKGFVHYVRPLVLCLADKI